MNLAEIRKKAGEARKPEVQETPAESASFDADVAATERDAVGSDAFEFPDEEHLPDEDAAEAVGEDFAGFDLAEAEFELLQPSGEPDGDELPSVDEREEFPVELAVEREPDSSPPAFGSAVVVAAPPAAVVRHPAYDPLSTLLAGRKAAAGEEETTSYEEELRVSGNVEEYLCFKVANEEYALSIMDIKEIIKPREVTEVPRMPKFVPGVISLRGVIIPIMDIRLRLSLPVGEPTGRERILVLKTSIGYCGVFVDEVIQVVRLQQSDIEGPPAILDGIDREFVMGLGRFEQRMLILLNLDSILNLEIH